MILRITFQLQGQLLYRMIYFLVILMIVVSPVFSTSVGAPTSACFDGMPGHGEQPQITPAPYSITVVKNSGCSSVNVTISENASGTFFKGFLIRAMDGDKIVGKFKLFPGDSSGQLINCGDGEKVNFKMNLGETFVLILLKF